MALLASLSDPFFEGALTWATGPGGLAAHWQDGLLLLGAGILGAALTVYTSEWGRLPRIGETVRIRQVADRIEGRRLELDQQQRKCQEQLARDPCDSGTRARHNWCKFLDAQIRGDELELAALERSARAKAPLYVALGAILAVVLAPNVMFAVLIGLTWPVLVVGASTTRLITKIRDDAAGTLDTFTEETDRAQTEALRRARDEGRLDALFEFVSKFSGQGSAAPGRSGPSAASGGSSVHPAADGAQSSQKLDLAGVPEGRPS